MRIYGAAGATTAVPAKATRRTAGGAFSVPGDSEEAAAPAAPSPLRMAGGIDALLALQGVEDATERRKRSVTRGRYALNVLEELKLGVLAGTLDPVTVNRLRAAAAGLKDSSGDPGLDSVLAEIELRVEVELAKMDPVQASD